MAGQGCINEGGDTRHLAWLVCPLQRLLSYKSASEPKWIFKSLRTYHQDSIPQFDYVSFGIAWPPYIVRQWYLTPENVWRLFRFGYRYDRNWKGYIAPTAANKRVDRPMEHGY